MSTSREWEQARRDLLEEGRKRVGPPPTAEEVEALVSGNLPAAEAQRIREVLAYYPDLVRAMTATAPPSDEPVLTDSERNADLARLRQRLGLGAPPIPLPLPLPRPVPQHRRVFALAAGVVIAIAAAGAMLLMKQRPQEVRPTATRIIIADTERGARGHTSVPDVVLDPASDYLLKPLYRPLRPYPAYRFELVQLNDPSPRSIWIRDGVERQPDGSFPVAVSTLDLEAGRYSLILYGIDGAPERLATYAIRIDKRD